MTKTATPTAPTPTITPTIVVGSSCEQLVCDETIGQLRHAPIVLGGMGPFQLYDAPPGFTVAPPEYRLILYAPNIGIPEASTFPLAIVAAPDAEFGVPAGQAGIDYWYVPGDYENPVDCSGGSCADQTFTLAQFNVYDSASSSNRAIGFVLRGKTFADPVSALSMIPIGFSFSTGGFDNTILNRLCLSPTGMVSVGQPCTNDNYASDPAQVFMVGRPDNPWSIAVADRSIPPTPGSQFKHFFSMNDCPFYMNEGGTVFPLAADCTTATPTPTVTPTMTSTDTPTETPTETP